MSVSLMKVSLSVGVLGFLAYCVYFDRKRRSDPNFKTKLRESEFIFLSSINFYANQFLYLERLREKQSSESKGGSEIPLFKDPSEMQAYFLKEVQASDEYLQLG